MALSTVAVELVAPVLFVVRTPAVAFVIAAESVYGMPGWVENARTVPAARVCLDANVTFGDPWVTAAVPERSTAPPVGVDEELLHWTSATLARTSAIGSARMRRA